MAAPALDDRKKPVQALRPADVNAAAHGPDPRRAALARHLRNSIRAEARRWTPRTVVLGFGLALGYLALQVVAYAAGFDRMPFVVPLVRIGGLILIIVITRAESRRRVAPHLAATAVAEGLCGVCCYSLRDLPREGDGCVVCPECGSAWAAQRITRPFWEMPAAARSRAEGGRAEVGSNWLVRFLTLTPPPGQLLCPDDRGRFVSVVDSRLWLVPRTKRNELDPDEARLIRRDLRRIGVIPRTLVALAPLSVAAFLGYGVSTAIRERDRGLLTVAACGFALFLVVGLGLCWSHAFYNPRRAARALAARCRCASCTRSLRGLPSDEDGCTVCPRCGASWLAPTIDR